MPSVIDQARDAGFSDDEITGWASGQIPIWKDAGFSDQEIGTFVTGLKRPGKVPPSLVDRLMTTSADIGSLVVGQPSERMGEAALSGFKRGFGEEPLGVPAEDREKLRAMGIYAEPGKFQPLRLLNRGIIEPSYLAAQTMFRAVNGALGAVGSTIGELGAEATGAEGFRKEQAREDATQFVNIAALLAGAHTPMAEEGGVLPNGRVADNIVGHLPKVSDFTDATKIVTDGRSAGGTIRDKLIKLYENRGILPAEVATDAVKDPVLKAELADPQAPLPAKYGGAQTPAEEVAAKVEKIEGASPAPSILDDIYGKLRTIGIGDEIAQHQAATPAAMFEQWGRRLGVDPMELYRQEGFDVRRDLPGVFDIGETPGVPEELTRTFEQRRTAPPQPNLFAEREAEGQMQIPGAERISDAELAQRRAEEPLKPTAEQKPMDIGLFSEGAKQKELFQFPAYHGSPHDFERFDLSAIGTGEGAQSYGHGLYFAENERVARVYQRRTSDADFIRKARELYDEYDSPADAHAAIAESRDFSPSQKRLLLALEKDDWLGFDYPHQAVSAAIREPRAFDLSAETKAALRDLGVFYKVRIKAEKEDFLDWNKPLSEQTESIRKKLAGYDQVLTGEQLLRELERDAELRHRVPASGESVSDYYARIAGQRAAREMASEVIREAGIPGIKYLDQGSRGPGRFRVWESDGKFYVASDALNNEAGRSFATREEARAWADTKEAEFQTHNYVLFDDSLIEITHKNGEAVTPAERAEAVRDMYQRGDPRQAGMADPRGRITLGANKAVIDLFATADRSTFLHETGHMWLDQLVRFAQEVPQGHEVRADLSTVMDWLGVSDPRDIGVAEHERFARGFEQFLRDGEAPSSRLAAAFEKFRQWLAAIYKQLTALGEPLSADVRGVMRRALASPAEIEAWTKHQEALARGQVPSEIAAPRAVEPRGAREPPPLAQPTPPVAETPLQTTAGATATVPEGAVGPAAGVVSRETVPAAPTLVRARQLWGPASRPPETWSLLEYLANRGGLKPSPDLAVLIGRGQKPVPGFGMLIRKAGMTMDEALQAAKDGGYLSDAAEMAGRAQEVGHNDLYALMDRELRGQKQYRVGYEPAKDIDPAELEARISEHLDGELEAVEVDPKSVDAGLRFRIFEIMTKERVADPLVAYEQAVMEEIQRGTETGQAERIPDHIPAWDVAHEPGTMEPAGGFARRLAAAAEPEIGGAGAEFGEARGRAASGRPGGTDVRGPAGGAIGGRPAAEPGLRDPLGTPRMFDQAGLPPDPNAKPYFTYDERGTAKKIFDRIILGWKNTFQPELISDAARALDPIIAAYKSRQAMGHDQVWTLMEEDHQYWRRQTPEQRAQYLDSVEMKDAAMPAEWEAQAGSHRELLDLAYQLEKRAGSKAAYVEDYVPHLFEDPEQFRNFVKLRVNTLGPTWFQKPRAFEFIEEAKAAGLRLRTDNPADLIAHRLIASVDMIERMRLLEQMQNLGMAVPTKQIRIGVPNAEGTLFEMPTETVHYISPQDAPGWQEIVAPNRDKWMIAPDAQALWKNGVEAKGLWANEGAVGSAFRGWMALKNVWVPIKLAFSLFHPLHVLHIQQTEYLALGWNALVKGGDPVEALSNLGGAVMTYPSAIYSSVAAPLRGFGVPLPRVGMSAEGFALREAWLVPERERTPWQQAQVSLMNDGGFVPQLSEQLKIAAKRGLEDAIDNNKLVKTAFMGGKRLIEVMQAPIFEKWIPSLKAASYMREATALLQRNPELLENDVLRQAGLRQIAKSIDNRFGEMFYGTLFWNRYVKDTGIGSFLSLGWNLGFAREFGGAIVEPGARLIERAVKGEPSEVARVQRDASSKRPFVVGYVGSAALTMGLMTYLFTGETPSGYDFFLPRIGGTNPDGSPRRITNMTYLREIPMLAKHIEERGGNVLSGAADMLYNKLIIQPMVELAKNASYFGYEIYDSSAPFWKQGYQAAKHVFGEQFDPMSAAGYRRAIQNGWSPWEASLAYLGFGPAPAYAERTATQNRIYYLYRRYVSPEVRPYELGELGQERQDIRAQIVRARDSGDHPALEAAAQKWFNAGGSRQGLNNIMLGTPGDIALFKGLPEPAQRAVLDQATAAEKTRYLPFYHHNTARKVADLTVAGEQARLSGNNAAASQAEGQINDLIQEAVTNGWITDRNAFRRAVAQELVARKLPEVSAILSVPKAQRGQAAPRLLGPSAGVQPMSP